MLKGTDPVGEGTELITQSAAATSTDAASTGSALESGSTDLLISADSAQAAAAGSATQPESSIAVGGETAMQSTSEAATAPSVESIIVVGGASDIESSEPANLGVSKSQSQSVDDAVILEFGYTASYTNSDLESLLAERGMSQLVPEIVGAFEFIEPVTEETISSSGILTKQTQSSAAGELIDLQAQLKQLRYAEALFFLSEQLGLTTVESGAGIQFDTSSAGASFLQPFSDEMKVAAEIIDYITRFYNSITSVLEAMDIRSNSYKTRSDTSSSSSSTTITDGINAYITDIVTNKVENSKSLKDYFRDDLQIPTSWYESSCNTALIGQLIVDVVSKLVFPITGYYFTSDGSSVDSLELEFGKGVLNLANTRSVGNNLAIERSALKRLSSIKSSASINVADMPDILSELSSGESVALESIGEALYMASRDLINYAVLSADTEIQNIINNSSDETFSFDNLQLSIEASLSALLGVDPFTETDEFYEISDIDPRLNPKSLILSVLPRNEDRESTEGKVASFDFSTYSIPSEGQFYLDTGKSYFIDEILTKDINETKEKIDIHIDNLSSLKSSLATISKRLITHDISNISVSVPGVDSKLSASALTAYFIDSFSKALDGGYTSDDGSTKNEEILMLVAAMSSYDTILAAYIIRYILLREENSRGDLTNETDICDVAKDISTQFWEYHVKDLASSIIEEAKDDGSLVEGKSQEFGNGYKNDTNDSNINTATIKSNAETSSDPDKTGSILCWGEFEADILSFFQSAFESSKSNIFDSVWIAAKDFEKHINDNLNSNIDENSQTQDLEMNSAGRILLLYFAFLEFTRNYLYGVFRVETKGSKLRLNFGYSVRAVKSVIEASERFLESATIDDREDGLDGEEYDTFKNSEWPTDGLGERQNIKDALLGFSTIYDSQLRFDIDVWNSMHYIDAIVSNLITNLESLSSTMSGNDISSDAFNEIISQVSSSEDFGRLVLVALTRDQLMLNRALYDSLSVQNREYPYLPATKAVLTNQMKNLATISTMNDLVQTESSGRKRILTVGLSSGFVERMRNESIDITGDLNYRKSNLIGISVWRRNLLDETEVADPKEFIFDLSKFIIEGRATDTSSGSESIDAAAMYAEGQSVDDLFDNITVNSYSPDGQTDSFTGRAYALFDNNTSITTAGIDLNIVYQNHVLDFYLKLYMLLTTGIDVYEDIFPFLEEEVLFTGPDKELQSTFDMMKAELSEMFPTKDATSQLNFDRLLGELSRSILLSPKKWRNRVVYPKIFDRTFCILIDESDWTITNNTSDQDDTSDTASLNIIANARFINEFGDIVYESSSGTSNLEKITNENERPTYYQFYVTIDLKPHYEEATTSAESSTLSDSALVSGVSDSALVSGEKVPVKDSITAATSLETLTF